MDILSLPWFHLPPLALLLLVVVALLTVLYVKSIMGIPGNLPPSPGRPFPIVGHLPYLGVNFREQLVDFSKKTGGIFSMYFGGTLVIFLSGYDVLKEALVKTADHFSDRPAGGPNAVLLYTEGIISNSGHSWKENRLAAMQILKEFFSGKDIMSQKVMNEVKVYLNTLAAMAGKASDVKGITSCSVSNVTCNLLFGKRFVHADPFFVELLHILDEFMELIAGGNLHQWFPKLQYLPGDLFKAKRLKTVETECMTRITSLIQKTLNRENDDVDDNNLIASYITRLEKSRQSGQNTELSEKHLERVVFDLMIGGSETTTTTLLWFYLYMIHHPEVQEKVHEEIVREIGHRTPTGQDRSRLNYVNAAILETQRLATISPLAIPHSCTQDTIIKGFTIPQGAQVFLHLDAVLLDETIWRDPKCFRPQRFLKEGQLSCPEQFVAFGLGKRSCMGESLVRMELFLFVVSVVQRFKILPAEPACLPPRSYSQGATCPPTPYMVRFVERETH